MRSAICISRISEVGVTGHARLIWGVNDYDEVATMSFAVDLVRLIMSAELASEETPAAGLTLTKICECVREGYSAGLKNAPEPFVLERRHAWLLRLVRTALKEPKLFWRRWLRERTQPIAEDQIPAPLVARLRQVMPKDVAFEFREMKSKALPKDLVVSDTNDFSRIPSTMAARLRWRAKVWLRLRWLGRPANPTKEIHCRSFVERTGTSQHAAHQYSRRLVGSPDYVGLRPD